MTLLNNLDERNIRKRIYKILNVQVSTFSTYGKYNVAVTSMSIDQQQIKKMENQLWEIIKEVIDES